jgi:hypothetical protein
MARRKDLCPMLILNIKYMAFQNAFHFILLMLGSRVFNGQNGDFGQNRKNMSTSNMCRIAGTHNAFRFFSF